MIINTSSLTAIFTGFNTLFNNAFAGAPSTYREISMIVQSQTSEENYTWLGEFAKMREWIGDRQIRNLAAHSHVIKNRKFEDTISVDRDKISDDQFGTFGPVISEMGRQAAVHPEKLIYSLLGTGFATACYDGQYFFDTDHPTIDEEGAEQGVSNMQAGAETPWYLIDASREVKPLIFQEREDYQFTALDRAEDTNVFMRDEYLYGVRARVNAGFGLWQFAYGSKETLDEANYEIARQAMMALRGNNGEPLGIKPTHLIVPNSLEGDGRRLLVNTVKAAGATNEWAGTAELIVTPYL